MLERYRATIWAALSLLGLLLACYGNSFQASWHYDDFHTIVKNERVHMTRWNWEQMDRAMTSGPSHQTISRPLARLSFAVNYKIGQLDVFGYHLVNFVIHWLAGLVLFLLIRGTLMLPAFEGRYRSRATLIAWIAAAFWACHPIQVTAVTYIVQRMTSLAGLFYLSAMYGYMLGRCSERKGVRWTAFGLCALSCSAALLTKENSVLLFYSLLLYDLLFFQRLDKDSLRRTAMIGVGIAILLGGLSLLYLDPQQLFAPYSNRPFTMLERLLTQPRVLFIYLASIAVPMTNHMAILHDVAISHSLFDPWTTLPAIAGVAGAVVWLCLVAGKYRLPAFCGLFFFLNHTVESSFLNLELIYEHRNYVPTMFLFLPVAIAAVRSLDFFYYRVSFQVAISFGLALWLLAAIQTTWSYNRTFRNAVSLWEHTLAVYPGMSLPYVNLGKAMWYAGERDACYRLIRKGIEYDNFKNLQQKGVAYYNLGLYAVDEADDLKMALGYFEEAVRFYDVNPRIWYELAQVKMKMGDFASAGEEIRIALEKWPKDEDLLYLKAVNDLKMGRYKEALDSSGQLMRENSGKHYKVALMVSAESYRRLGNIQESKASWSRLIEKDPDNLAALMALIELSVAQGEEADLKHYVDRILTIKGVRQLGGEFEVNLKNENMMPYVPDINVIKKAIHYFGDV